MTDLIPHAADRVVRRAARLADTVAHVTSHSLYSGQARMDVYVMVRRGVESWSRRNSHFVTGNILLLIWLLLCSHQLVIAIIKSVVTYQVPMTLELKNASGKIKQNNTHKKLMQIVRLRQIWVGETNMRKAQLQYPVQGSGIAFPDFYAETFVKHMVRWLGSYQRPIGFRWTITTAENMYQV